MAVFTVVQTEDNNNMFRNAVRLLLGKNINNGLLSPYIPSGLSVQIIHLCMGYFWRYSSINVLDQIVNVFGKHSHHSCRCCELHKLCYLITVTSNCKTPHRDMCGGHKMSYCMAIVLLGELAEKIDVSLTQTSLLALLLLPSSPVVGEKVCQQPANGREFPQGSAQVLLVMMLDAGVYVRYSW